MINSKLNFLNKKETSQIFKESILKPLIFAMVLLIAYIVSYFIYSRNNPLFFKFDYVSNFVGLLLVCDLLYMIYSFLKSLNKVIAAEKTEISLIINLLVDSAKFFFPALIIYLIFYYFFPINIVFSEVISKAYKVGVIFIVMFFFLKLLNLMEAMVKSKYSLKGFNNLKSRTIHTQIGLLKKILTFIVILFALSSVLLVFDTFRFVGATIFTSAGVLSAVLVVAGQKTVASIIAGLQIAFLQPIRVGDVVALENECGRIEEITLTYVTLALWDKRYLIVPIIYFIEKPFQNLTRNTAEIIGTVKLQTKYNFPLDALEAYARSVCEKSELWDRNVFNMQVTNTGSENVEVRFAVSATDFSKSWDLRCYLRRKLVEYMQQYRTNIAG